MKRCDKEAGNSGRGMPGMLKVSGLSWDSGLVIGALGTVALPLPFSGEL